MVKEELTQELVIAPDEVERLVLLIRNAQDLSTNEEAIGAFLLLLHSMAYCDPADREHYLYEAQCVLMLYTNAFGSAARNLLMELALRDEIDVESFTFKLFYNFNTAIMRRPDAYPAIGAKLRQILHVPSADHEALTEESRRWTPGVKLMITQTSGAMNYIIVNHSRVWRWLYRFRWFLAPLFEYLFVNRAWFKRALERQQKKDPMVADIKATQRGLSELLTTITA